MNLQWKRAADGNTFLRRFVDVFIRTFYKVYRALYNEWTTMDWQQGWSIHQPISFCRVCILSQRTGRCLSSKYLLITWYIILSISGMPLIAAMCPTNVNFLLILYCWFEEVICKYNLSLNSRHLTIYIKETGAGIFLFWKIHF